MRLRALAAAPAPVAKVFGSFLPLSVTVETTKAAAMKTNKT